MHRKLIGILFVTLLLCGCSNQDNALDKALSLRNRIVDGSSCCFSATVSADYGDKLYVYSAKCTAERNGDLTFEVISPLTIAGITGKISGNGGTIYFDDVVLAFPTIADDLISPVSAPWLFMKTLRSGYLKDCTRTKDGFAVSIDDSYDENAFQVIINTNGDTPISAEIFWNNRRILTISIEDFAIL